MGKSERLFAERTGTGAGTTTMSCYSGPESLQLQCNPSPLRTVMEGEERDILRVFARKPRGPSREDAVHEVRNGTPKV